MPSDRYTCPSCNSPQPIVLRERPVEGEDDKLEIYISCKKCRLDIPCYISTPRVEKARADLAKLAKRTERAPGLQTVLEARVRTLDRMIREDGLEGTLSATSSIRLLLQ